MANEITLTLNPFGDGAVVEEHELFDEWLWLQADRFAIELDEPAAVDGGGNVRIFPDFKSFDDLHEDVGLGGDLRGGEAFRFTRRFQCRSQ